MSELKELTWMSSSGIKKLANNSKVIAKKAMNAVKYAVS
tara:strand:- start:1248 stop:1364 length:117 start_codon:yes stop_codon:yes gene_type:complete